MKKRTGDDWFPFWIDKWLLGSTRDELTIEQCAVWVDFLALSYKDEGYIRANEGIPYPIKRLSGLLNRPIKLIQQTIDRCLEPKINKLKLESDGTLYVISHPEYELSKRHKRRLMEDDVRQKGHDVQKTDAKRRGEENREEEKRVEKGIDFSKNAIRIFEQEFERYWNEYDERGKKNKQYAKKRFMALCKKGKLTEFDKGFIGYANYLKDKRINENFDQRPKYFSTLISDYEEYIGYKYNPPM